MALVIQQSRQSAMMIHHQNRRKQYNTRIGTTSTKGHWVMSTMQRSCMDEAGLPHSLSRPDAVTRQCTKDDWTEVFTTFLTSCLIIWKHIEICRPIQSVLLSMYVSFFARNSIFSSWWYHQYLCRHIFVYEIFVTCVLMVQECKCQ